MLGLENMLHLKDSFLETDIGDNMKNSKLKVAAIMLMAALLITSCGKDTNGSEELSLRPTVESGGNQGLTEVFQMQMIYDAFVEDYVDHFDFNGYASRQGCSKFSRPDGK